MRFQIPETHLQGVIMLENKEKFESNLIEGDLGIQIAQDGRVWICINGIAFLHFSPHLNGRMSKKD